jgi:serine/threonine-protein kinase
VTTVGAYEIVYALKSGGMGDVLLGRRRGPGGFERLVAIKTIKPELAAFAPVRAMFLDEAGILARLNHRAIATVHDFGEEGRSLYLVMEYVAGIPFGELIARRPPPVIAARAIAEAARGLHAAHEIRDLGGNLLGVVHRDISPENLMLGYDGHVKVIDFGIALVKGRQAPVTELGTIKGKPPYMSPEQVKNEPIDRQSDVFSLAVVLHELLTGKPLFDGDSIYAVARAVEHAAIAAPSSIAGALPAGLDAAVMHALERERERRTPTAAAFAEELEEVVMAQGGEVLERWAERELAADRETHRAWLANVLAGGDAAKIGRATGAITPVAAPPKTPVPASADEDAPPRRRRVGAWIAAIAITLLGGVFVAYFASREGSAPPAIDAATVAIVADAGAPIDAPPIDAAPPPPPIDAAPTPIHRDARSRPTSADARTATPTGKPDAEAPITGTGRLIVTADPYATIRLDGNDLGPTPIVAPGREIPAGRHRIVLLRPNTNPPEVRHDETFVLEPGKTKRVQIRDR